MDEISQRFAEYKRHIVSDRDYLSSLKEKVTNASEERGLYPVMNDTKWLQLQLAIEQLEFPPPFISKYVTDFKEPNAIKLIPDYWGDWSSYYEEGLPPFFTIEWLKVIPKYRESVGRLVEGVIHNETAGFKAILEQYQIPYEETNEGFTIYGYRKLKGTLEADGV